MSKKKTYTIVGSAFIAGALLFSPISSLANQVYQKLTIDNAVDIMKEKDVQSKIVLEDDELKNWRIAFTPQDGFTPPSNPNASSWTAAYRTNVEPLRNEATKARDKYDILSGELQREANSYKELLNYWVMQEQKNINEHNVALAKKEWDIAKKRHDVGVLSEHDLIQVEMSLNDAQVSYDESMNNFNLVKYQLNQKLDQRITQDVEIVSSNFSFIPDNELHAATVVNEIFETHPSLDYVKKELQAYTKGHEVVTSEGFTPANETLPLYLEREVNYWGLHLKQQKQQLEIVTQSLLDELKSLKKAVQLYEKNKAHGEKVYNMAVRQFEEGAATFVEVDQARLQLLNTNLQLSAAKKDYMEKKESFRLLKEGHIPQP